MREPLTVRIADRTRVSKDTGESCWLNDAQAARVRESLLVDSLALKHELGASTATTLATIAEGSRARPVAPSFDREPTPTTHGRDIRIGHLVRAESRTLASVLASRYSAHELGSLKLDELATILVRTCRIRSWQGLPNGLQVTYRPVPSAGALHPCSVLIAASGVEGLEDGWWSFNALSCALERAVASPGVREFLLQQQLLAALEEPPVAALVVIADFKRTLVRYPAGTVHVWRDAGVLLATLHLCATDVALRSVITGGVDLLKSESWNETMTDVGALLVGR